MVNTRWNERVISRENMYNTYLTHNMYDTYLTHINLYKAYQNVTWRLTRIHTHTHTHTFTYTRTQTHTHTCYRVKYIVIIWSLIQSRRDAHGTHILVLCHDVLQCVAVCCQVLQCVALSRIVLRCVAVCCNVLQCVAVCIHWSECEVLQGIRTLQLYCNQLRTKLLSFWFHYPVPLAPFNNSL